MSDQTGATSTPLERIGQAVIARPHLKLMGDEMLKALARQLDEASAADSAINLVVLDLAGVAFLPSLSLGLLVQLANKCKSRGQRLVLAAVQPPVRQVFSVTRLDRLFQFADGVQEAITR